jgi:hypothetical protein
MVEIRRSTEQDWQTLKRVRLAALREAPYAFGSTYEKERQWDDDKWREWASWVGRETSRSSSSPLTTAVR